MNKDQDPKVVSSHQTVYKRTNVDLNSRWIVEWKNFIQGTLMTDLDSAGLREATAVLQCEEGDLVIACEFTDPVRQRPGLTLQIPHTSPRHSISYPDQTDLSAKLPRKRFMTTLLLPATMVWHTRRTMSLDHFERERLKARECRGTRVGSYKAGWILFERMETLVLPS